MLTDLGFTVLRQIPLEYLTGVARGLYSLHGGVLRDHAGRIVAHLATPEVGAVIGSVPGLNVVANVVQAYQLHDLSQNVQKVLAVSLAGTALSGLGLATSLAGFAYMSRKLTSIERRIAEVKDWLMSTCEGQLRAAVADLGHAASASDGETRRLLTMSAKTTFASLAHHYRSQAAGSKSLNELEISEDYSVTALLGAVMCTSDLGLHDSAVDDFSAYRQKWIEVARAQLHRVLDLDNASRLLDGRYADAMPASQLVAILDFARNDPRGLNWIDDLRRGYGRGTALTSGIRAVSDESLLYARRLIARAEVLSSYEEHFRVLAARRMSSSDFTGLVKRVTSDGSIALLVPSVGSVGSA
jgi:hypothetical protein